MAIRSGIEDKTNQGRSIFKPHENRVISRISKGYESNTASPPHQRGRPYRPHKYIVPVLLTVIGTKRNELRCVAASNENDGHLLQIQLGYQPIELSHIFHIGVIEPQNNISRTQAGTCR